jgi:hypothetical protein
VSKLDEQLDALLRIENDTDIPKSKAARKNKAEKVKLLKAAIVRRGERQEIVRQQKSANSKSLSQLPNKDNLPRDIVISDSDDSEGEDNMELDY